jgi:UPF0716 family protein affecting phage T7 exclusion
MPHRRLLVAVCAIGIAAIVAALVLTGPGAVVAAVGLLLLCLLPVGLIVAARLQPSRESDAR